MNKRINLTAYQLRTRSTVDMNHSWTGTDGFFGAVNRDRHELCTVCDLLNIQIAQLCIFYTRYRCERHKLRPIEAVI